MINVTNTPNPETKKLNIDFEISDGSKEFTPDDYGGIKLVEDLFGLNNLELIFIDKDFISIKKKKESDWANILPDILNVVRQSINKEMKKFFLRIIIILKTRYQLEFNKY